jgi:hypothetical protein
MGLAEQIPASCDFDKPRRSHWGQSEKCTFKPLWVRDDIFHQGKKLVACGYHFAIEKRKRFHFDAKDWHTLDPNGCPICGKPCRVTSVGRVCRDQAKCGWDEHEAKTQAEQQEREEKEENARRDARTKQCPFDPADVDKKAMALEEAAKDVRSILSSYLYWEAAEWDADFKAKMARLRQAFDGLTQAKGLV